MRNYLWPLGLILLVFVMACGPKAVEVVIERFPDGKPKIVKVYLVNAQDSTLLKETTYYQSGQKYMEGWYRNGQRDSVWTAWLRDGHIWSRGFYRQGIENGPKEVYHENGKLFYQGQYRLGQRTGVWKFYNPNGELIQTIDYDQSLNQ